MGHAKMGSQQVIAYVCRRSGASGNGGVLWGKVKGGGKGPLSRLRLEVVVEGKVGLAQAPFEGERGWEG